MDHLYKNIKLSANFKYECVKYALFQPCYDCAFANSLRKVHLRDTRKLFQKFAPVISREIGNHRIY